MSAIETPKKWRWIFIISETMAVGYMVVVTVARCFYPRGYPEPPVLGITLAYSALLAWLFLLIASPFFFRSLRGVAVAGWSIALAILVILISVLFVS